MLDLGFIHPNQLEEPSTAGDFLSTSEPVEEDAVSKSLNKAVRDLSNVKIIKTLSEGIDKDQSPDDKRLDKLIEMKTKTALIRMVEGGEGGGENKEIVALRQELVAMNNRFTQQNETLWKDRATDLQKQIEREQLNQQFGKYADAITIVGKRIEQLETQIKTPAQNQERSEIIRLIESLEKSITTLAEKQTGSGQVDTIIDSLTKLDTLRTQLRGGEEKKTEVDEGMDWKSQLALGITSTAQEIGKEVVKMKRSEYSAPNPASAEMEHKRLIERQVLRIVTSALQNGETELNAYEIAPKIGCQPEEVLDAFESLQKKNLITFKNVQKKEATTPEGAGQPQSQPDPPDQSGYRYDLVS